MKVLGTRKALALTGPFGTETILQENKSCIKVTKTDYSVIEGIVKYIQDNAIVLENNGKLTSIMFFEIDGVGYFDESLLTKLEETKTSILGKDHL